MRRVQRLHALFTVVVVTAVLVVLDVVLCLTGLFPPRYPWGHPVLGFFPNEEWSNREGRARQPELEARPVVATLRRNERGLRSSGSFRDFSADSSSFRVVVLGDSHTDLPYAFDFTQMGVLEAALRSGGIGDAKVLGAGVSRYSPLQARLLLDELGLEHEPDAIVLDLYTGNDLYDLLRTDDRPSFVTSGDGYAIRAPEFVVYADPAERGSWIRKSRLLWGWHLAMQRAGIGRKVAQVTYAWRSARAYGAGREVTTVYLRDLGRSLDERLWYDAALAAQVLNQGLFFAHFPGSRDEAIRRAAFLLRELRSAHPEPWLVLSPVPSRELVAGAPVGAISREVFERLSVGPAEVIGTEAECYELLRETARDAGWQFVDALPALRRAHESGREPPYLDSDLHLSPSGCAIVGRAQAAALLATARGRAGVTAR